MSIQKKNTPRSLDVIQVNAQANAKGHEMNLVTARLELSDYPGSLKALSLAKRSLNVSDHAAISL